MGPPPAPLTLHADGDHAAPCPHAVGGVAVVDPGVGSGDQDGSGGAGGVTAVGAGDGGWGVTGGPTRQRFLSTLQPREGCGAGGGVHLGGVWGSQGGEGVGGEERESCLNMYA